MNDLRKNTRLRFTRDEQDSYIPEKQRRGKHRPKNKTEPDKVKSSEEYKSNLKVSDEENSEKLKFQDKTTPVSKLYHNILDAPLTATGGVMHRKIRENEEDNVGVESAHRSEEIVELGVNLVREKSRAKHTSDRHRSTNCAHTRRDKYVADVQREPSDAATPQPMSNPVSKRQQKQTVKRQYAEIKRAAQSGRSVVGSLKETVVAATYSTGRKLGNIAVNSSGKHRGWLVMLVLLVMISFLLNVVSSCSVMAQGIGSAVSGSTYPSADQDMIDAEADYTAKETALKKYLDGYERFHDYDEYHYELDDIGHDPYVLISILSAYYGGEWTRDGVQEYLDLLFERQYILTEDIVIEERSKTEIRTGTRQTIDPETGKIVWKEYKYKEEVAYDYYICTVKLENFDLSHLPAYILDEKKLSMYAVYISTHGNRPDLFPQSKYPNATVREEYLDYTVPPEALEDEKFASMLSEAEKYLGYPYGATCSQLKRLGTCPMIGGEKKDK